MNTEPKTDRKSDKKWASYKQFSKATYFRLLPLFPAVGIWLESPSSFLSHFLHISLKCSSTVRYKTFFLNQMEKTDLESKEKETIFRWFLNEPDIARHRIIINSNYYSAFSCSTYWFHSPHFSLKFCARHSCTSVLQKCAKTSIVCVSCIILPAVSCLRIDECGEVNLRLLCAAFPGVTDLELWDSSLVEGSAGGSGNLFPRLHKVKLYEVRGLSVLLGAVLSSGKWRRSGGKQSVKQSLCARWCCA